MDCYPLDITLVSADNLKKVNIFTKMNVYVLVSINGDLTTARKSTIDKNAGSNPSWNHLFRFELDEYTIKHRSILFILKSDRTLGDRDIGEVSVCISDLFDQSTVNAAKDDVVASPKILPGERIVEHQVRTKSGKPKGSLKFTYKFGEKYTKPIAPAPNAAKMYGNFNELVTAYPPAGTDPGAQQAGMMYTTSYPQYPAYALPPQSYVEYPPPQGGYPGYPPAGYLPYGGYQQEPTTYVQQPHNKKMGGGSKLGLGLGTGLLGGLLVGDMIGDVGEMAAYDAGDYEF